MPGRLLTPFDLNRLQPILEKIKEQRQKAYPYPQSAVCKLILHTSKGEAGGSGFLIHPRVVLTAGHCVLESKKKYFRRVEVIPGLKGQAAPSGVRNSRDLHVAERFFKKPTFEWDFGFILLDDPVEGPHFELAEEDKSENSFTISGYAADKVPGEEEKKGKQQKFEDLRPEKRLKYQMQLNGTLFPGQSGSPVYYMKGGKALACAVYNGSLPNISLAVRVRRENVLREWERIKKRL